MIQEELQPLVVDDLTTPYYSKFYQKMTCKVRNPESWKKIADEYPGRTLDDLPGRVWLWSDLHFGHKNILKFSDRPYEDTVHMREQLILEHNVRVNHDDTCIVVGDFAFLPVPEANDILHRLNGYKVLIIGNHDVKKKKVMKLHFDEILICAHMNVEDMDFLFTHYPCHRTPDWCFNIHGHEHVAMLSTDTWQHFNVNCELQDYHPILMDDIVKQAKIRRLQL